MSEITKEIRNHKLDKKSTFKSEDKIWHVQEYDINVETNEIYLMGVDRGYEISSEGEEPGVEWVMSKRFIKNMHSAIRNKPNTPIIIHMKTNGGDWQEGMAIYDTIRSCPWPVTILNYTHARSMSSIIFQAANKRIMMPHSYFMVHDGDYGIGGTMKQVRSAVDFDKHTDKVMMDIYVKSMKEAPYFKGKTDDQIAKWLRGLMDKKEDVYFTAEEAVLYGFADEIYDYNMANLTIYTHQQLKR